MLGSPVPAATVTGQSFSITATVTGTGAVPTGSVTFLDGGTPISVVALTGGTATFASSSFGVGAHVLTAVYSGDVNFTPNTSSAQTETVARASTLTALVTSVSPSTLGQFVTFKATVSVSNPGAGVPGGIVEFFDGSTKIGTASLSAAVATFGVADLQIGSHSITANYLGDAGFESSGPGSITQIVQTVPSTTTLAAVGPNPSLFGQTVTFVATVSTTPGTAAGTVEFYDGATRFATAVLVNAGGVTTATATFSGLTLGAHSTIVAKYLGDGRVAASNSVPASQDGESGGERRRLRVVGDQFCLRTKCDIYSDGVGSRREFRRADGDGSVQRQWHEYWRGSDADQWYRDFGAIDTGGEFASDHGGVQRGFELRREHVGFNCAGGERGSDDNDAGVGDGSVDFWECGNLQCDGGGDTSGGGRDNRVGDVPRWRNRAGHGDPFERRGEFHDSGAVECRAAHDHRDICGRCDDGCECVGDFESDRQPAGSGTVLGASPVSSAAIGQNVILTATVTGVPALGGTASGLVTFLDNGTAIGTSVLNGVGVATFTTHVLTVGSSHSLKAQFGGDANFNASLSNAVAYAVTPASTTTGVVATSGASSVFGSAVTFTAHVTVNAPGSGSLAGLPVSFLDGAATIGAGVINVSGDATFTTAALNVGTHAITASFAGNANFAASASASAVTQTVTGAATLVNVSSAANPSVFNQNVIFTATVVSTSPDAGLPTGTIEFKDGAASLNTVALTNVSGVMTAAFASSTLSVGNHPITALFAANGKLRGGGVCGADADGRSGGDDDGGLVER